MSRPKFGSQTTDAFKAPERVEIGAIWKRTTKQAEDMLNIKLSKQQLSKILDESSDEDVFLVAFTNKTTNDKQPNFRVYNKEK